MSVLASTEMRLFAGKKHSPSRQILNHLLGQHAQIVAALSEALEDDRRQRDVQRDVLDVVEDALEALFDHLNRDDAGALERLQQIRHRFFGCVVQGLQSHDDELKEHSCLDKFVEAQFNSPRKQARDGSAEPLER